MPRPERLLKTIISTLHGSVTMITLRRMAVVAGLLFAGLTAAAEDQPVGLKKGDRIVFLGDSITQAGVGTKGYVTLIKNTLKENHADLGIEVIGAGISGNK